MAYYAGKILQSCLSRKKDYITRCFVKGKLSILPPPPPPSASKVKSSDPYKKTACFKPFTKESDFGSSPRGSEIGDCFFTVQSVGFVQSIIK